MALLNLMMKTMTCSWLVLNRKKMDKFNFQYCQKIVVFSRDGKSVLLCKRQNEADFDGEFSFIGGKLEKTDNGIVQGLKREKDEEVGKGFKVKVFTDFTTNVFYVKKDGQTMILPHYYAIHVEGEVELSKEYSEFRWVKLEEVESLEPKIFTIPETLEKFARLKTVLEETESVVI